MDTSATAGGSRQEDEPERLAHYSTGRLTCRQAQTVNAWRDLLVPTQDPPGDRPRASRSDAIAAAVTDLLRAPPAPLEVARYAYAGMAAQLAAAQQKADPGTAPLYPPVSWYLPADAAQQAEQLRTAALNAAIAEYTAVAAEARRRHPQPGPAGDIARAVFTLAELARRGLPPRSRQMGGEVAQVRDHDEGNASAPGRRTLPGGMRPDQCGPVIPWRTGAPGRW